MDSATYDDTFKCADCRVDTLEISEYYMVRRSVWTAAVSDSQTQIFLCIGCLERRLGRVLVTTDFAEVPLNYFNNHGPRLKDRLGERFQSYEKPLAHPNIISRSKKQRSKLDKQSALTS